MDISAPTKFQKLRNYLSQLLVAVLLAVAIGSLVTLWVGENPLQVYLILFQEAFLKPRGLMITIQRATPLILTSAAATMAFRAGAINMGMAGQFMVGGAFAAMAGYAFPSLPKLLHVPLALLLSAAGGAAAAFVPAIFKRMSGISEVITGMIANLLMPHLLSAVINSSSILRTARFGAARGIQDSARLTQFVEMTQGGLGAGTKANTGILIAIGVVLALGWWMKRSTLGFEVRMTKNNYTFAEFTGINASRGFFLGMMLSGAIAALAGAVEVLGVWRSYRLGTLVVGWKGLVISLIGAQTFVGSMIAALFTGAMESGTMNVSWATSIPRPLIDILVELIIIFAAVPSMRMFFSGDDDEHLGGRFIS